MSIGSCEKCKSRPGVTVEDDARAICVHCRADEASQKRRLEIDRGKKAEEADTDPGLKRRFETFREG